MQVRSTQQLGFTLIEVLVTMGIFVIVTAGASALLISSIRSNNIIWETLTVQQDGRQALQEILDDVRRAEVSSIGSYPIVVASDTEFIFYANVDSDPDRERVAYWLFDDNLYKGVTKPTGSPLRYPTSTQVTKIVASGVKNTSLETPVFSYYDASYTGVEDPLAYPLSTTAIRVVKITLELDQPKTKNNQILRLESLVHIRNLKQN